MKSFRRFKTQINELFDKPARWRLVKDTGRLVMYSSDINDKSLSVAFLLNRNTDNNWTVLFDVDGSVSITGEGDEIKIFSTVFDTMKDFIQKREPEQLYFTAEKSVAGNGDSRIRLYTRLIKQFSRDHGYRLADKDYSSVQVAYTLVKV